MNLAIRGDGRSADCACVAPFVDVDVPTRLSLPLHPASANPAAPNKTKATTTKEARLIQEIVPARRHSRRRKLGSSEVAANSLTGADIDEAALAQVPSAALGGIGRSAVQFGACESEEPAFLTCAFTTIDVPVRTRVLVIGTVKAQTEPGGSSATGQCRILTNREGTALSGFTTGTGFYAKFVPLIGIADVGPGPDDVGIECNELDVDIEYIDARVVAVALSPN